jgi:phosphatidylglycerophosphate synthase
MNISVASTAAKPAEVEGFFDTHFYTPLGGLLTRALARTALTPNDVSWLSVAAAFAAALAYFYPTLQGALTGSVLLLVSGVLDSADGQLARATKRTSELGETLDGFCDSLSFGLIYAAAALSFVIHGRGSPGLIAVLALVAAFSHSLQSSLVDFERQLLTHYLTGRGRVLREDGATLRRDLDEGRARGEGWWPQLLRKIRISYCGRQRQWLRGSVALLDLHQRHIAPFPDRVGWFADRYRDEMRPLLRAWTLLAPNSHTMGLLVCGLLPFALAGTGVARMGLALVFAFDIGLNFTVPVLLGWQARVDRRMVEAIATLDERAAGDIPAFNLQTAR